jgi:hypothetical protein
MIEFHTFYSEQSFLYELAVKGDNIGNQPNHKNLEANDE